jgi:glycosyltransferase involved in cell wall biosynthesis
MPHERIRQLRALYVPDYDFAAREREAFLRIGPRHFFTAFMTLLGSRGWDVDILAVPEPQWAERLPQTLVRGLALAVLAGRYDLAVGFHGSGLLAAIVRWIGGSRKRNLVLIMFRPPRMTGWRSRLIRRAARLIRAVLIVSPDQADEFAAALGLPRSRIHVIPFGVDTSFFTRSWRGTGDYVLVVGDADRDNAAVARVASAGHRVIKTSMERRDVAALRTFAGAERVTLKRHVSYLELRELYANARLVISPLQSAGHPAGLTSLAESIASGCPVLISDGLAARLLHTTEAKVAPDDWVSKVDQLTKDHDRIAALAEDEYLFIERGAHLAQAAARVTSLLDHLGRTPDGDRPWSTP